MARRQGNQSELTYRQLKDLIVSGQLEPGERLVEAQIAEELGVSRTPVREALRRLLDEHLISRDTTGALTVHRATQREIEDIYTIREVLDGLAARLAARRISETDLLWMTETIETMREAAADESGDVVAANLTFHDVLYGAAGNPRLTRMGQELRDFVRLFSREPLAVASPCGRDRGGARGHPRGPARGGRRPGRGREPRTRAARAREPRAGGAQSPRLTAWGSWIDCTGRTCPARDPGPLHGPDEIRPLHDHSAGARLITGPLTRASPVTAEPATPARCVTQAPARRSSSRCRSAGRTRRPRIPARSR